MSMRRAHIPPSPPRQPPNRWRLAVFSLGSPEFTQSVQELVTQHLQRHANRASAWRDQNGGVEEVAPLDVGSVWELQGLGIDIVRGSQEKTWGTTVFRALGQPLMRVKGWEPNAAVLMAAWCTDSVEANLSQVTPEAKLVVSNAASGSGFLFSGLDLETRVREALENHGQDIEQVMRAALSESAFPKMSEMPGWKEAKQAALDRHLPRTRMSGPKPRF